MRRARAKRTTKSRWCRSGDGTAPTVIYRSLANASLARLAPDGPGREPLQHVATHCRRSGLGLDTQALVSFSVHPPGSPRERAAQVRAPAQLEAYSLSPADGSRKLILALRLVGEPPAQTTEKTIATTKLGAAYKQTLPLEGRLCGRKRKSEPRRAARSLEWARRSRSGLARRRLVDPRQVILRVLVGASAPPPCAAQAGEGTAWAVGAQEPRRPVPPTSGRLRRPWESS